MPKKLQNKSKLASKKYWYLGAGTLGLILLISLFITPRQVAQPVDVFMISEELVDGLVILEGTVYKTEAMGSQDGYLLYMPGDREVLISRLGAINDSHIGKRVVIEGQYISLPNSSLIGYIVPTTVLEK